MKDEATFGPGTDLVISMFSMALILIAIVSGLYFDAVNAHARDTAINQQDMSESSKVHTVIRTLEREITELKIRINQLIEKNKNLVRENTKLRRELLDTLKALNDLKLQYLTLEATNIDLTVKFDKWCKDTDLEECGGISKRSRTGKVVYWIMQPTLDLDNIRISTRGKPKIFVSRIQAHEILRSAQNKFDNQLYIGSDIDENLPRKLLTKLVCEFRQYDYYQYHDKNECRDYVPLIQR